MRNAPGMIDGIHRFNVQCVACGNLPQQTSSKMVLRDQLKAGPEITHYCVNCATVAGMSGCLPRSGSGAAREPRQELKDLRIRTLVVVHRRHRIGESGAARWNDARCNCGER